MNLWIWASLIFSSSASGGQTRGDRLGLDPVGVEPAAVVGDADDDVAALVIGGQADGALLALAAGETLGRGLQAMVGGVAHHVGERVLDQVEHLAVELGVGTVHLQLDLLAEFAREIADDAGQLLPGIADRLHARLHDAFLQLGGDVGQPLQRHLELGVLVATGDLQQLVAGQHQLGDHGHQMLQRIHVDADRLVGDAVALGGRLVGRRLLRGGLCLGVLGVLRRALGSFLGHRRRRLSGRRGRGRGLYFSFGNGRGGRGFDRGLAEGALELVERHFAQTQRPLQGLVGQRTGGRRGFNGDRCFRHQRRRFGHGSSSDTCGHRRHAVLDHRFQLVDQVAVGALGLGFGRLESPARISLMRSIEDRITVTACPVTGMPSRNLPISVSPACASASRRGNPRKPQVPLMVWTRRKMLSRILALFGSCSNFTS
ncbi:hypothetical protein ACVWWR_004824 [Bradyrhizobium sp. LM3.2]